MGSREAALEPHDAITIAGAGEEVFAGERARLVRLCARLTGDPDAADDLAQEALLVAYDRGMSLRRPDRRWPWLAGIARHLSVDWVRRRIRERTWLVPPDAVRAAGVSARTGAPGDDLVAAAPDSFDVEVELEHAELSALLDRAMALLPPGTRRVMVERLVDEVPQARVALRLGLTEGAVEARLHRGRLALRRLLTTELREEAVAYGLAEPEREAWQPTRVWCPVCGKRRLVGRFADDGSLWLDCIDCPDALAGRGLPRSQVFSGGSARLFAGVKGFKPALNRFQARWHTHFGLGTAGPPLRCARCGCEAPLRVAWDSLAGHHFLRAACSRCGNGNGCMATGGLALALPEGRAFWRAHPRLCSLPEREVEAQGRAAVVLRLRSVTGSAELAVVFARDTLQVLAVHGAGVHGGAAS